MLLFSVSVMEYQLEYDLEQLGKEKLYSSFRSQFIIEGTQDRISMGGGGIKAETMKEDCFLACSLLLAQLAFLYSTGPPA